jgi:CBS domain-containing membrane protein
MNITRTVHPPAGAVALTAIVGGPGIVNMGFGFVATSAGGSLLMILFALLANNLMPDRQYPQYW